MKGRELKLLAQVVDGVAATFGPYCEVVLHDLTRPDHSIAAISNGHVTGRKVGDSVPDADLYRLSRANRTSNSLVGYRAHTSDGRPLRSTTIFIRDASGEAYAAFGINIDLSLTQALHAQTAYLLQDGEYQKESPIAARTLSNLMKDLVDEAIRASGKAIGQLDRDDRVQIARHLEQRGVFAIRRSVATVARRLGVSRMAMYTYIEEARRLIESSGAAQPEGVEGGAQEGSSQADRSAAAG